MGHEIPGTQPTELGLGIPPTSGLVLGKGQPECHCLPLGIVQGLGIGVAPPHDTFSHGDPPTSSNFLTLLGMFPSPVHLIQDPSTGWFTGSGPLFALDGILIKQ